MSPLATTTKVKRKWREFKAPLIITIKNQEKKGGRGGVDFEFAW
jgi:hypothetical protein